MASAPQPLGPRRDEFDVPPQVAYFNTANLAPLTHRVREAGARALERRSRPWTIAGEDWFTDVERLRELFARLIGADADGIALVPATSYGFAVAATNLGLGAGDRVLVLAEEYPSGIYTWRATSREAGAELVTVEREPGQGWTEAILAALDERVSVVSVPNVHWTDGALVDLDAVSERVRALGCRLIVDASQSAGAMPLDVGRLRPDYLVSVGYKWLLGPFALSFLYVAPEHRDGGPLEQNWIARAGSQDFARLGRLPRRLPARREALRHGPANELSARADGDRGDRAAARVGGGADRGHACRDDRGARRGRGRARARAGRRRGGAARTCSASRCPRTHGPRPPRRSPPRTASPPCAATRCGSRPHLHNTPDEVDRLLAALATAIAR